MNCRPALPLQELVFSKYRVGSAKRTFDKFVRQILEGIGQWAQWGEQYEDSESLGENKISRKSIIWEIRFCQVKYQVQFTL
jgi:hypothetical protein